MSLLKFRPWWFGLTNGTTLTTSNVKDITNTVAATLVTGAGTQTVSNTQTFNGGNVAAFTGASGQNSVARFPLSASNLTASYSVTFYYSGTAPGFSEIIMGGRNSGANVWGLTINTGGHLVWGDAVTTQWTSAAALSAGWYRFAVYATTATTTTGTGQAAYYSGSSNTAIETTSAFTTLNLGTTNQTEIEVGRRSTPAEAFTVYVATVQTNDGVAALIPADTAYDQINDLLSVSNLAATFDEILELTGVAASAGTYDQIVELTAVAPLSGTLTVNAGLDAAFEPNTVAKLNVTLNAAPASVVWAQTGGLVVTLIGSGRNRAYLTPAVLTSSTTLTFTVTVTPAGGGSPVTDTVVHTVYPHQVWQLNAARTKVPVFLGGTPLALPDPDSTP